MVAQPNYTTNNHCWQSQKPTFTDLFQIYVIKKF